MPITPFIGVRISWLMRARNSLFALLARSAASLARVASAIARLQLPVGVAEIVGALRDLLLEELPVPFQPRIALPDLGEHLIEAVDERADLVLGAALDAQAVVLLQRHALHGVREVDDGAGNLLLQPRGEPVRGDRTRRQWPPR